MTHETGRSAEHHILAINCGSSSLKFALYLFQGAATGEIREELRYAGSVEDIGESTSLFRVAEGARKHPATESQNVPIHDHTEALHYVLYWLEKQQDGDLPTAVGHRIVHGGSTYEQPQLITAAVIATLRSLIPLAPLHLPIEIGAVEALRARYPTLPQVACFDTAFHRTMPRVAKVYGIPRRFLDEGVEHYGFHGLSYEYIMARLAEESGSTGRPPQQQRLVIAHLGNGASMVAVQAGRSVDTTMGLTPIGGLVMSTRSGDLDPGILLYLLEARGLTPADLRNTVERDGGLLGVSGSSADMQDLLAVMSTDERAAEAVLLFTYTARKHIGALASVLGGLDSLIFTGGIGEHSAQIRQGICDGLGYMGIHLDPERNATGDSVISALGTPVTVRVIETDEELMIARHTRSVVQAS
ncbi:MAG: acetate/propionate family kinase [Ktedonobacterales bacterium]